MVFPGSPVVKTPHFNCWRPGFDPLSGNYNPMSHIKWQKKKRKLFLLCVKCLLCARHCAKDSQNPDTRLMRWGLLLFPFDRWGKWVTKRLNMSPKAPGPVSGGDPNPGSQNPGLSHVPTTWLCCGGTKMFPWRSLWARHYARSCGFMPVSVPVSKVGMWQDSNPLSIKFN